MNSKTYNMGFIGGSILHHESIKLANLYLIDQDWSVVRDVALAANVLQARTINSAKRICREIVSRLQMLGTEELEFLVHADSREQGYVLWLAICRRYEFMADFAVEVLRERYINFKTDLPHEELDYFFNKKSEWHPELEKLSFSSINKVRQIVFRMLREAGLLDRKNMIIPATPGSRLLDLIKHTDLMFFPMFESKLQGIPR